MYSNSTVLTDSEHHSVSLYSAEIILNCREKMKKLEVLYGLEHIPFPFHCTTNFRDSWFHYKKVFERFDSIKVHQEQYAMEEHLIRVMKDAIAVLFNIYAQRLEDVHYLLMNKQDVFDGLKNKRGEAYYQPYDNISINSERWYDSVCQEFESINHIPPEQKKYTVEQTDALTDVILYLFLKQADINYQMIIKQCMHEIKNNSLKLRLEGIEIYRAENSDVYFDNYIKVFRDLKSTLDNYRIFSLLKLFSSYSEKYKEEMLKSKVTLDMDKTEDEGDAGTRLYHLLKCI